MTGPAPLRPMRLPLSIVLFGGPMLLFLLLQRVVAPALDARGVPPLVDFYVLASPHVLFFFGALVACRLEGNPWSWPVLRSRLRLVRLRGRDWTWALLATAGLIGGYIGMFMLARPLLEVLAGAFPDPRGYIFPRQELAHGSRTWIVHGLLWAGFHLFSPTSVVMLLPGSLLLAWIVQRRGKTWIALIAHGSLNSLAMIRIVAGIAG